MKRPQIIALVLALLALGLWLWTGHRGGPPKEVPQESPLYSGKEPKAKISLCFPSKSKAGFVNADSEIYVTSSRAAQVKQALIQLFKGPDPSADDALPAFPLNFKYREVFITAQGLAVIDLDADSVASMPGGTSAEFVSLYCLLRSVLDNFKDVKAVQILVGGQAQESLDGHMDISEPLSLADL